MRPARYQSGNHPVRRSGAARLAHISLTLFFVTTLVAPAALLNKLLFAGLFVWVLFLLLRPPQVRLMLPALVLVSIFAYGLLLALVNEVHYELARQFFLAVFVPSLLHLAEAYEVDIARLAETSGRVLVIATGVYALLLLGTPLPFNELLTKWFEDVSLSAASERDYLDAPILSINLGTTPFLFLPWCIVVTRLMRQPRWRDAAWLLLIGAAVVVSGSRGLVALCGLFALVVWLERWRIAARMAWLLVFALALGAAFAVLMPETTLLSSEETSNAVKIGHLASFIDSRTLANVLFGSGLGSVYFSSGSQVWTPHTELTPVDMMRYLGVPLALLAYGCLAFPVAELNRYDGRNRLAVIAFMLYLLLSATNPVLFNSYGMLVTMWYWQRLRGTPVMRAEGAAP